MKLKIKKKNTYFVHCLCYANNLLSNFNLNAILNHYKKKILHTVFGWTNLCGFTIQEDGLETIWRMWSYHVKRFEGMKLEIMKQPL